MRGAGIQEEQMDEEIKRDNENNLSILPCSNCGKPVLVPLPFVGCVFCVTCGTTHWSASSENISRDDWIIHG